MRSSIFVHPQSGRLLWQWATCILLTVALTSCLKSKSKKLGERHDFGENDSEVVLVMGDSISAGGFSGGAPWPARLNGMIGKTVVNDSSRGAASTAGASRIDGQLRSRKPGFVIICYGANDAIRGIDIEETENALRYMARTARDNQSIPLIATVLPMTGAREIFNGGGDAINQRIYTLAKQEKAVVVNLNREVSRDLELYLQDGLHLSDLGEELVALTFMDVFD